MAYGLNDIKQAALGAIIASLVVILIRSGNPIKINPIAGLIVGLIWIYIVTKPFIIIGNTETYKHAVGNVVVTLGITTILSLVFNLVELEQLKSFSFFGSTPFVMLLVGLPTATFFDKRNIKNIYSRWFFKRMK